MPSPAIRSAPPIHLSPLRIRSCLLLLAPSHNSPTRSLFLNSDPYEGARPSAPSSPRIDATLPTPQFTHPCTSTNGELIPPLRCQTFPSRSADPKISYISNLDIPRLELRLYTLNTPRVCAEKPWSSAPLRGLRLPFADQLLAPISFDALITRIIDSFIANYHRLLRSPTRRFSVDLAFEVYTLSAFKCSCMRPTLHTSKLLGHSKLLARRPFI